MSAGAPGVRAAATRGLGHLARRRIGAPAADHLSGLLDALPGFVGLLAPDGTILQLNRAARRVCPSDGAGLRGVALADAPWWSALPKARARVGAAVVRAAGGAASRIGTEIELPNGRIVPIALSLAPLCDARGRTTLLVASATDLGARQRARTRLRTALQAARQVGESVAALHESERQFERLVQGITDYALFMLDPAGRVSSWNAGAARIKGYGAGQILGRSFECFFTEEDRAAGVPAHALAEAARTGRSESEGWRVRRDGTRFWANGVVDAIRDDTGKLVGFAKITRDITERREMDRWVAQAQKMDAIGQLTGGIAHDFNNLLQAVSGNLELARSVVAQGGTARTDRLIGNAQRVIARAGRLTSQLLAFSRRQILHAEHSRVSDLAADMIDLLDRAGGEGVQVLVGAEPGLWSCRIDPGQFESALLNLVQNARDAMPRGGNVSISMENVRLEGAEAKQLELAPGEYVRVEVADPGIGMPPEILAHAFEPFFTTKEIGKGSGLGLPQVMGFTKQSGGSMAVRTAPGQSTTVSLLFPRDPEPDPSEAAAPTRMNRDLLAEEDRRALEERSP